MASKPKTARPVFANRGLMAAYKKALLEKLAGMRADYLAAAASGDIVKAFKLVGAEWSERINGWAPLIADSYMGRAFMQTDSAFVKSLADAGWIVKPEYTPQIKTALVSAVEENVALIKSIPEQFHQKIEKMVYANYLQGADVGELEKELKKVFKGIDKRATLIARDQIFKANASVVKIRQLENGITEAIWIHSGGGKVPRQSHVAAGRDRQVFKIAEGCYLDGEYIQPGELINCRCVSRPILPV